IGGYTQQADKTLFSRILSFSALAFIPFGFGATASNAILIIAILRSEQLRTRHEIQVMCALSFADFVEEYLHGGLLSEANCDVDEIILFRFHCEIKKKCHSSTIIERPLRLCSFLALATLVGGVYRSTVILINSIDILFTPLQCMLLPHSWAWRWSDFATSFMLLTLTVDRLISRNTIDVVHECLPITSILLYLQVHDELRHDAQYHFIYTIYLIRNQLKVMSDKLYPTQVSDTPFLIHSTL
uniref:Uncharacterized protein n=1 Tax=Parascaris equorum TaxID=6256 RepID=A0A914RNZ0_PAREQ